MMHTVTPTNFLIVDDDVSSNFLCESAIQVLFPGNPVKSFTNPETALRDLTGLYSTWFPKHSIVVFLDINMPQFTGWGFLERFEKLDFHFREQFVIFMLTSSIDPCDEEKAKRHPVINGFLSKPLIVSELRKLFPALLNT